LERAFDVNRVPPQQRDGMRTLVALRQLSDPKLSVQQRRDLVLKVANGIEVALPSLNDPIAMRDQANALLDYGVERDANALEYWGENPRTQASLRPIVEAAIKLLDKTAAAAQKRADAIANQITSPNDPKAKQWETLADLATGATYKRHKVDYYWCLALERGSPQRKEAADGAIKYLSQYDNA